MEFVAHHLTEPTVTRCHQCSQRGDGHGPCFTECQMNVTSYQGTAVDGRVSIFWTTDTTPIKHTHINSNLNLQFIIC